MALTSSMEDYLEAVFMLQKRKGYARCTDVAEHLGVKKPSVSRAVKELSKMGYLLKEADGTLSLTEQGKSTSSLRSSLSKPVCLQTLRPGTHVSWNMLSVKQVSKNSKKLSAITNKISFCWLLYPFSKFFDRRYSNGKRPNCFLNTAANFP